MAEQAALTIEDTMRRLRRLRARIPLSTVDGREAAAEMDIWLEELQQAKACVLCKGPVAKRLVPAKALDYDSPNR